MADMCGDNRFELIEKYKQKLINATNIEEDEIEMAEIILFRFWQMGWLDKLEESDAGMTVAEYRERMIQAFHKADCDSLISVVVLPVEKEFRDLEWLLKKKYVPFLKKANKALKAQQWIPCSERMPEAPFGCLVTVEDEEPMTGALFPNLLPYFVGWDGEQWNDADGEQCPFEVLAWMPLPEPYEE